MKKSKTCSHDFVCGFYVKHQLVLRNVSSINRKSLHEIHPHYIQLNKQMRTACIGYDYNKIKWLEIQMSAQNILQKHHIHAISEFIYNIYFWCMDWMRMKLAANAQRQYLSIVLYRVLSAIWIWPIAYTGWVFLCLQERLNKMITNANDSQIKISE